MHWKSTFTGTLAIFWSYLLLATLFKGQYTERRDKKISSRPIPRLFFETKYFWDRYRDFFSRLNIFETDTETFFWDQNFRDRDRYSQKIEKSLDTEKSRDEMSHSDDHVINVLLGFVFPCFASVSSDHHRPLCFLHFYANRVTLSLFPFAHCCIK